MVDPDTHENLDKFQQSIHNASNRFTRSQIPSYDPKVVNQHKRPPKIDIYNSKTSGLRESDFHDGEGGDGVGDLCIHQAQILHISGAIG